MIIKADTYFFHLLTSIMKYSFALLLSLLSSLLLVLLLVLTMLFMIIARETANRNFVPRKMDIWGTYPSIASLHHQTPSANRNGYRAIANRRDFRSTSNDKLHKEYNNAFVDIKEVEGDNPPP